MQQPNSEEPNPITTITGRPITVPVSFRLATDHYQKLQERAAREGKKVAVLLEEWVTEKLSEQDKDNPAIRFTIETEQEADGRFLAEVLEMPGIITYGKSHDEAMRNALALALEAREALE